MYLISNNEEVIRMDVAEYVFPSVTQADGNS